MFKFPDRMNNPLMRTHDNQTSLHVDSAAGPLDVPLGHDHKSKTKGALAMSGVSGHFLCPPRPLPPPLLNSQYLKFHHCA